MKLKIASRGRAITLTASALAAVAFAAAMAGRACRVDDDSPEGAARAFATAARTGDREAIYELLGPETRARLEKATKYATELVGGPTRFDELDLIGLGTAVESFTPEQFKVTGRIPADQTGTGREYKHIKEIDRVLHSVPGEVKIQHLAE